MLHAGPDDEIYCAFGCLMEMYIIQFPPGVTVSCTFCKYLTHFWTPFQFSQPVSGTVQREGNWKLRKDEWKEEEKLTSKLNSDILDKKTSLFLDKVFKRSIMHFVLSDTSMFSVELWGRTDVKYIKILTNIQDAVCRISKGAGKIN